MEHCGNCKHWDTWGFGLPDKADVGQCNLVARDWYPMRPTKMIALKSIEHVRGLASELIEVVTRREFGCNQFESIKNNPA